MLLEQKKNPTGGDGVNPNGFRWGSNDLSLSAPADVRTPRHISQVLQEVAGDLTQIHPRALDVFEDGYLSGHREGWRAGYVTRAREEVEEWAPVRDHLAAYVRSMHGLKARRRQRDNRTVDTRTGAELIAAAHHDWGIPYGGGQHVA